MYLALAEYDWFYRIGVGYPFIWVIILFWIFAFGSCLGSFLNVCIWRIPRGESLSKAASHCGSCNAPIKFYDNIPLVSYLVLRGRCRACHQHYSMRYFLVELICGILFTLATVAAGLYRQPMAVVLCSWITIFYAVGIAWIDAEHRIIPDKMSFPCIIAGLLCCGVFPEIWGSGTSHLAGLIKTVLSGAIPALFLTLFAWGGRWIAKREVIGWGDVKYMLTAGVLTGISGAFFALLFASFTGTVFGIVQSLLSRRPLSRTRIPLGPFLAAGTLLWLFAAPFICKIFYFFKFN